MIASSGLPAASRRLEVSASNVANQLDSGPLPGSPNAGNFPAAYVPQRVDQVAVAELALDLPMGGHRAEIDHPSVASGGLNLGGLHGGHQGQPFGVRGRRSLLGGPLRDPLPGNWASEGHLLRSVVTKIRP